MRVYNVGGYQPTFGIKVPTKRVLEAATGVYLDEAKVSYPAQTKLLKQVGNLTDEQVFSYHLGEALTNMGKIFKQRHPNIAKSSERIQQECEVINKDRSFLPKEEIKVKQKIDKIVGEELEKIGTPEMDVEPMTLEELGYDKSRIIAESKQN